MCKGCVVLFRFSLFLFAKASICGAFCQYFFCLAGVKNAHSLNESTARCTALDSVKMPLHAQKTLIRSMKHRPVKIVPCGTKSGDFSPPFLVVFAFCCLAFRF